METDSYSAKTPCAVQISFAPFLLPGTIDSLRLKALKAQLMDATGLYEQEEQKEEHAILGGNFIRLCGSFPEASLRLYISHLGVGVLRFEWPACPLTSDPKALLLIRRKRHAEIIDGVSEFGRKSHLIVHSAINTCAFSHRFISNPFKESAPFEYLFSMFEFDADCKNSFVLLHESALLAPSRFGLSDTTWAPEISHSRPKVRKSNLPENCEESDLICCRASWASLVYSGKTCHENRELYAAFEVKIQAIWLFAHRVSRVQPTRRRSNLLHLEMLAFAFERIVTTLLPVDDPTANERVLALHKAILASSDVLGRVDAARQNIQSLRAITSAQETRRQNQFESVTQVLLFLIASLQLLPTIVPVPLTGLYRNTMLLAWVIAFLVFVGVRLRIR